MEKLYTQEDMDKSYDVGVKNGKGHSEPSKDTLRMIGNLEKEMIETKTNQANYTKQMEEFKKENCEAHKEIKETNEKRFDKVESLIADYARSMENKFENVMININKVLEEKADKTEVEKKSNKWVETLAIWFLYAFGIGFLGVIGTLIYNAIIHFGK